MIPLFKVNMSPRASESVEKVLSSGYIGQGPKVDLFEELLWKELNCEVKPITLNSCTSALDLALHLIGVNEGDEVISTPQTCFATQISALHRGLKIRWADIDSNTGCIKPSSVKNLVNQKTKAIFAVNWAGRICDFKTLKTFGIPVIEDAAHCWDVFNNEKIERGDYICYSLQAIKFLTSSDGGILIPPKDKEKEARLLRWYGLDREKGQSFRCTQDIENPGFKYHMNDVSAAIGIENIPIARISVDKHRENSRYLYRNIKNKDILLPEWNDNCSYWLFTIHILTGRKKEFTEYMQSKKISVSPVHFRNDKYTCTNSFDENNLKGVNEFTETQIAIPNGWWLNKKDLDYIIEIVNNF